VVGRSAPLLCNRVSARRFLPFLIFTIHPSISVSSCLELVCHFRRLQEVVCLGLKRAFAFEKKNTNKHLASGAIFLKKLETYKNQV
jgi:hypothetical protein